jgi:hypothetical protein
MDPGPSSLFEIVSENPRYWAVETSKNAQDQAEPRAGDAQRSTGLRIGEMALVTFCSSNGKMGVPEPNNANEGKKWSPTREGSPL